MITSNRISVSKLQTFQFVFTVITALATGIWGYFIHAAQEKNNAAQINIRQQQVTLQKNQSQWQKDFQKIQNKAQQKQLDWQADFQKLQLSSQEQIAQNISKLNSVTAMNPFIDKIVDSNPAKARIAAYGLYLLNRDDPRLAVTLIAATKKQEMNEVLITLGKMDARIVQYIGQFIDSEEDDAISKRKDQKGYIDVIQRIQVAKKVRRGYCFFGRYIDNKWAKQLVSNLANSLPKPGEQYSVVRKTFLRASFPTEIDNELELGRVLGVNRINNKIKILNVKCYLDGAVWCEIKIMSKGQK